MVAKEILAKYGNTMTMIDVTYKTTKHNIPLFFLTVHTNAGYTVAAEFIVQVETAAHIEEALTILKKWNPTSHPKFIMCDYSEAEMSMESAFPSTTVYMWLSQGTMLGEVGEGSQTWTHRNRCWTSWPPSWLHGLHHHIQMTKQLYHLAVDRLKASQVWLQNDYVQTWLNKYWLSIPKVKFTYVFAWEQMPVVPKFEGVY